MGISTISKPSPSRPESPLNTVSIPNGDKHDFKTGKVGLCLGAFPLFQSPMGISTISKPTLKGLGRQYAYVSIPNGDKHDFKTTRSEWKRGKDCKFQSPMGISTISKLGGDECCGVLG